MRSRLAMLAMLPLLALSCGGADKPAPPPGNGLIAADWQGDGIYLMNADGSRRRLIPGTESAGEVAWSPDGRLLAFDLPGKEVGIDVYTIRPDGSRLRRVLENAFSPSWSPDGERLLVLRDSCPSWTSGCGPEAYAVDLVTVGIDGKELHQLAHEIAGANSAAWSPDGKRIAFVAESGIYVSDSDGSGRRRVRRGGTAASVAWSPDGSKLVFDLFGGAPDWGDIAVLDVATGKWQNLTHRPGEERNPTWSPEGDKIAFVADMNCVWTGKCDPEPGAEGPAELWVMDATGTNLRQITRDGGLGYGRPSWQPLLEPSAVGQ